MAIQRIFHLAATCLSVAFILIFTTQPAAGVLSQAGSATLVKSWTRAWGGASDDGAGRVAVDASGNVYVVGDFTGTADFDPDPLKTDVHTSNSNSIDAFIAKYDASGNFLWAKTWGGIERDVAYGVDVDAAGNAYVVGPYRKTVDFNPDPAIDYSQTSNGSGNNIYLSKFAPDGTFQWVRAWGPNGGGEGYTVQVHGDVLYVVGDFSCDGTCQTDFNPWGSHDSHPNQGFFDAFLSKFDLNGNFQWARTWGGEGYDDGPGVAVDSLGSVYVAGMYGSQTINFDPAGGSGGTGHPAHDSSLLFVDVFLSKFDANGNFQWVRTWGGQGKEDASGNVAVDQANNVYIAGRFGSDSCDFNAGPSGAPDLHSTNGGLDAFVSKFSPDGTFQWAKTWGGSLDDMAGGLAVDGAGHIFTAGRFHGTVDFNPGSGVDNHSSNDLYDAFLSQFDSSGNFVWAGAWGGSGDDMGGVYVSSQGAVFATGEFTGATDFDPGSGADPRTSNGLSDAFLSKFFFPTGIVYLPIIKK